MESDERPHTNLSALEQVACGDASFKAEILGMIVSSLPGELAALSATLAAQQWESLARTAHKAKSTCAYAGSGELQDLLKEIEACAGSDPNREALPKLVRRAANLGGKVVSELHAAVEACHPPDAPSSRPDRPFTPDGTG